MINHLYIKVKGTSQGPFTAENPGAGEGRSLCHRYRFKGTANNDPTRGKNLAVRSHEPLVVVKPLGASSPQFLQAFWSNEVLSEVHLILMHADGKGKVDDEFQTIELTNATIASIEHHVGHGTVVPEDTAPELEEIAFRFEAMTIKSISGKTAAKYDWKNQS